MVSHCPAQGVRMTLTASFTLHYHMDNPKARAGVPTGESLHTHLPCGLHAGNLFTKTTTRNSNVANCPTAAGPSPGQLPIPTTHPTGPQVGRRLKTYRCWGHTHPRR